MIWFRLEMLVVWIRVVVLKMVKSSGFGGGFGREN